jgi:arylsulfatase A-like enzyme
MGEGEWRAALPSGGATALADWKTLVLLEGERTWRPTRPRPAQMRAREPGLRLDRDVLVLQRAPREALPDELVLRVRLVHGASVAGRWRSTLADVAGDGLLVFPGERETIPCTLPPESQLVFTPLFPESATPATSALRVTLDGTTLLELAAPAEGHLAPAARSVALDGAGARTLGFEVQGTEPVFVVAPVIGPRALGRPGARPWPETRPDLVLVICDTFRADNLAAFGGDPALAPNLNHWVERSLRFLDARAAAAWTLPSIGTILSGVFPGQHGGTDLDRGVVEEVESLAEVLGAHGYRTAAITDSGLFSRHYGQDQGFEWFQEVTVRRWNLARTIELARARMAADDGRPLFLVVHTYRVHGPMRVGRDEDGKPWREVLLALREKRRAARAAAGASDGAPEEATEPRDDDPELQGAALRFYHDAVEDLDFKLGAWLDELEGSGFFERGVVALTADHGNSYGEHGELGHGGNLFDVKLHVPLFFAGRGLEPRAVSGVVSLIDLAPTLAALAGAAPAASWPGRSLLASAAPRPAYAFDQKAAFRQIAVFAEGKKLLAPEVEALRAGAPTHAFDLAADAREERNLAPEMRWPGELGRVLAPSVEALLVPAAEARTLELPPEVEEGLNAIGYGR